MGFREIEFSLPTAYTENELKAQIRKKTGLSSFSYEIRRKSLDARRKGNILWRLGVMVISDALPGESFEEKKLEIPFSKRNKNILIAGSGPAGIFAAYTLQTAGFSTRVIERGSDVEKRAAAIERFEAAGEFSAVSNYAFGEGGAGTFSDGKLTSRTKSIKLERNFIFDTYIEAGAPAEIKYMTHPHLGTDNLKKIVKTLRLMYEELGGKIMFETELTDIIFDLSGSRITEAVTSAGSMPCDELLIAPGHSAFDTYRMLMRRNVPFRNKNFAIGSRVEHPQNLINRAQWGIEELPGVKAAEYRLTSNADDRHPVYTFCMCPGGKIVQAAAFENQSIVNGMSEYQRAGQFANAACVAGISIDRITGRESSPLEALDWLESLEERFFKATGGYSVPCCSIADFTAEKNSGSLPATSYSLGLSEYPLWKLFPESVYTSMKTGLRDFSSRIRGFETGIIMGLESKTSSPVQAVRNSAGLAEGFENLYIIGEGSGYAGGIISSAADGVKTAMCIINQ